MFQASLAGQQTKKDSATSKNKELRAIDAAVERMRAEGGFVAHAKMDRLKGLLLEHFAPREDGDGRGDLDPDTTRVMVFCSFRACLEEIVVRTRVDRPAPVEKLLTGFRCPLPAAAHAQPGAAAAQGRLVCRPEHGQGRPQGAQGASPPLRSLSPCPSPLR